MALKFYYSIGGERFGPLTGADLRQKAVEQIVTPDTLVWWEGQSEWVPASELKGLFRDSDLSTPLPTATVAATPRERAPNALLCPFCRKEILPTARKCKHCGKLLDEDRAVLTERTTKILKAIQVLGASGIIGFFALVLISFFVVPAEPGKWLLSFAVPLVLLSIAAYAIGRFFAWWYQGTLQAVQGWRGMSQRTKAIVLGIGMAVGVLLLGLIIAWMVRSSPRFTEDELDDYEQAAVRIDDSIDYKKIVDPEETNNMLIVLTLKQHPAAALPVWKQLRPLLEKPDPRPADFAEMRDHVGALFVLASLFGASQSEKEFDELQSAVIKWDRELRRER